MVCWMKKDSSFEESSDCRQSPEIVYVDPGLFLYARMLKNVEISTIVAPFVVKYNHKEVRYDHKKP